MTSRGKDAAEQIYARFLAAVERGEAPSFEELVAKHPEEAAFLRRLHAERAALDPPTQAIGQAAREQPAGAAGNLDEDPLVRHLPDEGGGKRLGPCVLLQRIGEGGFGRVYRARHLGFDLDVAVKCLKPDMLVRGAGILERFRREARVAVQITDEHVVRIHDAGHESGVHYLVMEFVAGETAMERVARKGPLHPPEAVRIAQAVAAGLAAMHRRGVVHRDVKPQNVLISARGAVKLADLGLARPDATPKVTATGDVLGTPHFMAPEQFSDPRSLGPTGDIYALGATLYYLLVGRTGVGGRGSSYYDIADETVRVGHPRLRAALPGAPRELAAVVDRCTRRQPGERFPDASALVTALNALGIGESADLAAEGASPTLQVPPVVSPPPYRPLGRVRLRHVAGGRRLFLLAGGLGVVVVIAVVAFLLNRAERERPAEPGPAAAASVDEERSPVTAEDQPSTPPEVEIPVVEEPPDEEPPPESTGEVSPPLLPPVLSFDPAPILESTLWLVPVEGSETEYLYCEDLPNLDHTSLRDGWPWRYTFREGRVDDPQARVRVAGAEVKVADGGRFRIPVAPTPGLTVEVTADNGAQVVSKMLPLPRMVLVEGVRARRGAKKPTLVLAHDPEVELVLVSAHAGQPAFLLGRYEISNAQYRRYPGSGGETPARSVKLDDVFWKDAHPVVRVTVEEAEAYCRWAGGRLPRLEEWCFAAGGPEGWEYPFSRTRPSDTHSLANWSGYPYQDIESVPKSKRWKHWQDSLESSSVWEKDGYLFTAPVKPERAYDYPPGPFFTYQQAGNVAELCDDNAQAPVVAGGDWGSLLFNLRVTASKTLREGETSEYVGFRILVPILASE